MSCSVSFGERGGFDRSRIQTLHPLHRCPPGFSLETECGRASPEYLDGPIQTEIQANGNPMNVYTASRVGAIHTTYGDWGTT